ncbi:hypothetical protein T440DRAFT_523872 [Plenodomus tracheiphilus IPT5]|uniref:Fungal-type protein kinase domain-containing protein n=1 Tax=Plenodomus tracheiphilus IPT5 TaxID=1408161 RepID=A0A6A7ALW3_9PLEO|nr:hypothetical protein T440DRAFT_523872 [Plenodomus tracheiphilus IPT5]
MPTPSRSQIIQSKPIAGGLDRFCTFFNSTYEGVGIPETSQVLGPVGNEETQDCLVALVSALQTLPASRHLPSTRGGKNLLEDLSRLMTAVNADDFDIERILPLLRAALRKESDNVIWNAVYDAVTESTPPPRPTSSFQQTPLSINTGSFANSTEHRKHVDDVLKEELGHLYVGVPGFFGAFFGDVAGLRLAAQAVFDKCQEGDSPLYQLASGWQGWPEGAKENDVLNWFAPLIDRLLDLTEGQQPESRVRRRPLAQPHQPVQGSTADRKLDIGFVDDPNAGVNSKCRWSQILIPGELKSNPSADRASKAWLDLGRYAREVLAAQDSRRFVLGFTLCGSLMRLWSFDRLGGIASEQFDINNDGLWFVSTMLGFLWMNEEQLGFDPTIITVGDKRYIEVEREHGKERLVIDRLIKRVRCIAGRATTCWKAYKEEDPNTPLVVKDSWQYPEREEEGELLREATEKDVVNVARYYYHETVRVGTQDDSIRGNVRQGLDVTKATNYKPGCTMLPPSTVVHSLSRKGRSSSAAGRKRSSSCTNVSLPPSKRTCSSSPVKGGKATADRVHRRVIVRDYGKPIYMASSRASLLAALEGCIAGYESLYTQAGMLQCDISPNNLMVNEDEGNPSWFAFLIDLDLAIKEDRDKASGARGKTGTRAFMAIGILYDDEQHSFMHDLESFFWVLFWICIHYNGSQGRVVQQFDKWNYANTEELAKLKLGTVSDDEIFRKTTLEHFTDYYQPLIPCVNRLRRKIFPGGARWRVPNPKLYLDIKEILRAARDDMKELEG